VLSFLATPYVFLPAAAKTLSDLPAADGSYTLSATAIDAAGNRAPEVTRKVITNTTAPAAPPAPGFCL